MDKRRFVERYCRWNRVPVGDETTRFVAELAEDLGADILKARSGEECLTWIMPPKWTVRAGHLETVGGKRLADFDWNPLYLKSYSTAFSGRVSRADLLDHVLTDPERPEAILYDYRAQYMHGERTDWGFSLPWSLVDELNDPEYSVHIDVEFSEGTLDVLDLTLPGEREETVFFAAHSCHPAQANDGLACVGVLRELFHWLKARENRRYTYRLIVGPEYFAAAALLERVESTEHWVGGFFLDMLGNGKPLAYSRSHVGNSIVDLAARNVLRHYDSGCEEYEYRGLYGNDELFYDGPGFMIPTIGLGREYFDRYHTHQDDADACDFEQLDEAVAVLKSIVEVLEKDRYPLRMYQGPAYLSRYGLYIDPKVDRRGYRNVQELQIMMDGKTSCLEMAEALNVDVEFVLGLVGQMERRGLVASHSSVGGTGHGS